jgi:hypothetical protein
MLGGFRKWTEQKQATRWPPPEWLIVRELSTGHFEFVCRAVSDRGAAAAALVAARETEVPGEYLALPIEGIASEHRKKNIEKTYG